MSIEETQDPRKVLWLTKGLGRGGAERLIVDSASLLDRDLFDLHIAYVLPYKSDLADEARSTGSTVTCLGGSGKMRWLSRLARLLRDQRFDIVHTHAPLPAVAARLLGRRGRACFVHTEHNLWSRYRAPTRALNAVTYRRNAAVIAVSDGVRDSIGNRWLHSTTRPETVIHGLRPGRMHVGSDARDRARERLGFDTSVPLIGTVGNLTPKKDHATLLRAFRSLTTTLPGSRLVVIGSGPLEQDIRDLVEDLGIADAVSLLGKRADVDQLLPAFDVFTLSSKFEGLPIALLEAMSARVACVATAAGGIPEVIADEATGLLVPVGDDAALAAGLHRVLSDGDLRVRLGNAAAEVASQCDLTAAVKRHEELYHGLLASRGA